MATDSVLVSALQHAHDISLASIIIVVVVSIVAMVAIHYNSKE